MKSVKKPAVSAKPKSPKTSRPSLRPIYPAPLRTRALGVIEKVESGAEPAAHASAFGDVVVELTEAGMAYFFLKPLELAKVGFVVRQGAELGMGGALRVLAPVVRTIVTRLDREQLVVVAGFVRDILA